MKILVTFAVEAEFAPWRRIATLRQLKIGGLTVHQAAIGRAHIDFVVTGMGQQNSSRAVDAALTPSHDFCIASGFAGALRSEFAIGDIVVARAVRRLGGPEMLESSPTFVAAALKQKAKLAQVFLTADAVISTAAEKSRLAPMADAVDMETFAVFAAAQAKGRPAVAIRAVSDCNDQDLPSAIQAMVDDRGNVSFAGVLRGMAQHPAQLPALIRLGRDSHTAAAALASFLEGFVRQLAASRGAVSAATAVKGSAEVAAR